MPNVGLKHLSVVEFHLVAIKELTPSLCRHLRAYLVCVYVQFTCNNAVLKFVASR
jgi:hypothetical protein